MIRRLLWLIKHRNHRLEQLEIMKRETEKKLESTVINEQQGSL